MPRSDKFQYNKEKGYNAKRGGRFVCLEEELEIDTTSLSASGTSQLDLEKHSGQWHCSHTYIDNLSCHHGGYAGFSTTEDVLKYLKEYKGRIPDHKKKLDELDANLDKVIKRLESE